MILISSCSILHSVEGCLLVCFGNFLKMARLFQELKLDFDREEQIADHTAPRFNLLMRTNSCKKIIGIYFNGQTLKVHLYIIVDIEL